MADQKKILRLPDKDPDAWIRTCQECGAMQVCPAPNPDKELTKAFRDRKCRKCRSEALDYGTKNGSIVYDDEGV